MCRNILVTIYDVCGKHIGNASAKKHTEYNYLDCPCRDRAFIKVCLEKCNLENCADCLKLYKVCDIIHNQIASFLDDDIHGDAYTVDKATADALLSLVPTVLKDHGYLRGRVGTGTPFYDDDEFGRVVYSRKRS